MSRTYKEMQAELTYEEHLRGHDQRQINKYKREINGTSIDVYDVLKAFNVTNPATAHAVKKLLASGKRGYKDVIQDLEEAKASISRAVELER